MNGEWYSLTKKSWAKYGGQADPGYVCSWVVTTRKGKNVVLLSTPWREVYHPQLHLCHLQPPWGLLWFVLDNPEHTV